MSSPPLQAMPRSLNAYVGLESKFGRSTQISMLLRRHTDSLKHCLRREIFTRSCKSGGCIYNPVRASSQHLVVGAQNNNRIKRAMPAFSLLLKNGLEQQYLHSLCTDARFSRSASLHK